MPHTKSAKKRLRQNGERRVRNKNRTTEIKTLGKQILRAVHDGQPDEAKKLYTQFTQRLDQAASQRVIHANAASRSSRAWRASSPEAPRPPRWWSPRAATPPPAPRPPSPLQERPPKAAIHSAAIPPLVRGQRPWPPAHCAVQEQETT